MNPAASYHPGAWVAIAGTSMWLIADIDPGDSSAAWALVSAAAPVPEVVTALLGAPTRPATSFAVARLTGRSLQVAVRGEAEVVASVAGGDEVVAGVAGDTRQRAFEDVDAVALGIVGATAAGPAFPLGAAVVPAARVMVTAPVPAPVFAPPPVEERLAGTLTSEPTRSSPAEEGLPAWMVPVTRSAPPSAAPPPQVSRPPYPASAAATPAPAPPSAAPAPAPPSATPAPAPPSAAPVPVPRPAPGPAPSVPRGEPAAGANPSWMQPSKELPPDLAWAAQAEPTPPSSTPAWAPGPVEEEERHTVMRDPRGGPRLPAVGQIVLSTGEMITLDGGVILGRAPGDRDRDAPYRIKLASPDGTISRLHVAVRTVGGEVVVEDLESSNGTWVTPPGGVRERLARGERRAIQPGTVVHLDEATWFTFELSS